MTVSKEQLQRIAVMSNLTITENVLEVIEGRGFSIDLDTGIGTFQGDGSTVRILTRLSNERGTKIEVEEHVGGQRILISARHAIRNVYFNLGLDDPTVRFLPDESNNSESNIPPEGVIFIDRDMHRLIELDKEGEIRRLRADWLPPNLQD